MKTKLALLLAFATTLASAQNLTTPPEGGNKKAMVGEWIGITQVTIHYDRPGVKGREGKLFGNVVHTGFQNLGFGTSKAAPWRAGANENTTIEFSTDVKVEGQLLPAGKYGFFVAYDPNECTVIFSKNSSSWGSYFYSESEDALRIKVKPAALDKSVEWLKYEFINQSENSATIALEWEKLMVPFKVEVDLPNTILASHRNELRGLKGFNWQSCNEAATTCLKYNTSLEEGLRWSNEALMYEKNYTTLSTNAALLDKLGKKQRSDSMMTAAIDKASMIELHSYGRKLLFQKKNKEALEIFKQNAKKHPKEYVTYMGLIRGYSANGDYKNAITSAKQALSVTTDPEDKQSIESMIQKLEKGTDIN